MKKLYSLFILSILALTMFVGCQNPTDGTTPTNTTPTETTPTDGTGNGAGTEATEYTITIDSPHGTVELDKTKAKAGETVRLTITPDSGYVLDSLSVKTSDTEITTTISDDKTYATFTMPNGNVSVKASFKTATPTPTDDNGDGEEAEDPVDDTPTEATPTVDADEATYGFTKTVNYTVEVNGQSLTGTKTGAELIAIAKAKNLVKDTDYTIDGTTVSLTASGVEKYLGQMTEKYSLSVNASEGYLITGGGMKEAGKTVILPITHYDGTDYVTPTATERYLVKVHIYEGETELNIEDVKIENNKITFTMPDKNINVFAEFYDIRYEHCKQSGSLEYEAVVCSELVNSPVVTVVLCFNSKAYDNLEKVGEKYVLEVLRDLESSYAVLFTETKYGNYELSKTGTLDESHYTFGVIDANGKLTILKEFLNNTNLFAY